MEYSNIHKTLIELEENLKNLESARVQVDKFSLKSEQILAVFTRILHHLESLQTNLDKENTHLTEALSKKYTRASEDLIKQSKSFEEKSDSYINMLSRSYLKIVEKINDLTYTVNDASEKINQIDLTKKLDEFAGRLDQINQYVLSYDKDLNEFRKSVNYNLQKEFKQNTDNILNLLIQIDELKQATSEISKETTLVKLHLENRIDELNTKNEKNNNELNQAIKINFNSISAITNQIQTLKKQNYILFGLIAGSIILSILILALNN